MQTYMPYSSLTLRRALPILFSFILLSFFAGECVVPAPSFYKVTLDPNEGTAGTVTTISVEGRKSIRTLSEVELPKRTNFNLREWNTKKDGSGEKFEFGTTIVTSDITVYAQWTGINRIVTLNENGGKPLTTRAYPVAYNGTLAKPNFLPERDGHKLKNWNTKADGTGDEFVFGITRGHTLKSWNTKADGNGIVFSFGTTKVTGNLTLYAQWLINSYTVTFNPNEGIAGTKTEVKATHGSTVEALVDKELPTRENYTLIGWNTEANGNGTPFNFATTEVKGNLTLYAQWQGVNKTVTLVANEGYFDNNLQTTTKTITVRYGSMIPNTSENQPTRTGFAFAGWNKQPDGKGTDFTGTVTENVTLYAKWTTITHTVTLNANYGTPPSVSTIDVAEGETVPLNTPVPTRTGYHIKGWYINKEGTGEKFVFGQNQVRGNIVIYAQWEINEYTVTLDANRGAFVNGGFTTKYTVKHGQSVPALAENEKPKRNGYTLNKEWDTKADGTGIKYQLTGQNISKIFSDVTLYVQWQENQFTVIFNTDDGGSAVPNAIVNHGGKVTKPADPTRAGYTFGGWYKEVGLVNLFNFDTEIITANITLYAKWQENQANQFTVTFNTGVGGSIVTDQNVVSGGNATRPQDPTREGYTFGGWYKEVGLVNAFNFDTEIITANITLYAKWTSSTTLITYIDLDKTSPHVTLIGKTTQLTARVSPEIATNKGLTWTTNNTTVATVDETGLVTTHAKGKALITATSTDGSNKRDTITIDVHPYFYVPDNNFRKALKDMGLNWFTTVDGVDGLKIEEDVVAKFDGAIIVNSKSISSLKGIEYFVNLDTLICYDNKLDTLDLSKNVDLTILNCSSNKLTTLDLSKNVALTTLNCYSNNLTTLDLSKNVALTSLWCDSNQLTTLDIRGMRSVYPPNSLKIITGGSDINNGDLTTLKVHVDLKTHSEVQAVKIKLGDNLTISTWSADQGSTIYTSLCSDWNPAGSGSCND
ncbi:hypothetical protein CHS0354_023735 [Potamilus streckersoni]|uniref:BIG2 domain-containing protein n=1 Tax=Potamilus streckersoni TaxID=2493646 RepID=A0AAE0RZ98_9BIVA|nr:hypothetical protein CHS0354_023735 [Potamilus streckersoni]